MFFTKLRCVIKLDKEYETYTVFSKMKPNKLKRDINIILHKKMVASLKNAKFSDRSSFMILTIATKVAVWTLLNIIRAHHQFVENMQGSERILQWIEKQFAIRSPDCLLGWENTKRYNEKKTKQIVLNFGIRFGVSPNKRSAPRNNLQLKKAKGVLEGKHDYWYQSEQLIAITFFDDQVSIESKQKVI